ncbi:MAG TPA: DNA polymerase III subunit delta' [Vicinamibacterales bacterium]
MPFRDIVGHRRLVSLLSRACARETLPPSLLFAGPSGVGKRRVALAIAEAVNCLKPRASAELERDACGECASCKRIARGVHLDVIVIEPGDSGSIKIEQVRDVIDRADYRPFEGKRRVVIIDEADALVAAAQNALLKTLEEPPSASIFVLVSSMPDALLPTVISRCPRLRFAPLSTAEVTTALIEGHGYGESDARATAADADGSIGRALEANSADLAEARGEAGRLLQHAARVSDPGRRIDAAKNLITTKSGATAEREQLAACLRALASLLRDTSILALGGDRRMLGNADLEPTLMTVSRTFDGRRSMLAYTAVDEALAALAKNVSPKVVADWLVLQL